MLPGHRMNYGINDMAVVHSNIDFLFGLESKVEIKNGGILTKNELSILTNSGEKHTDLKIRNGKQMGTYLRN